MLLMLPACAQNSVEKKPEFADTIKTSKPPIADSASEGSGCADEPPYDYPTDLKGGYRLVYRTDSEFMYLDLYKGAQMIKELTSFSCGLLHKNLGYIAADFDDMFVLAHSYGGGNPHEVELLRKSDGVNFLAKYKEACWVGADEKHSVFIYSTHCVPEAGDTITLLNLRNGKKLHIGLPKAMLNESMILGRIDINKVTQSSITLKFNNSSGSPIQSSTYEY